MWKRGQENQIKSNAVISGTGAMGRYRAEVKDREVQGRGQGDLKEVRELVAIHLESFLARGQSKSQGRVAEVAGSRTMKGQRPRSM